MAMARLGPSLRQTASAARASTCAITSWSRTRSDSNKPTSRCTRKNPFKASTNEMLRMNITVSFETIFMARSRLLPNTMARAVRRG
jgi:hypothetical protein